MTQRQHRRTITDRMQWRHWIAVDHPLLGRTQYKTDPATVRLHNSRARSEALRVLRSANPQAAD